MAHRGVQDAWAWVCGACAEELATDAPSIEWPLCDGGKNLGWFDACPRWRLRWLHRHGRSREYMMLVRALEEDGDDGR